MPCAAFESSRGTHTRRRVKKGKKKKIPRRRENRKRRSEPIKTSTVGATTRNSSLCVCTCVCVCIARVRLELLFFSSPQVVPRKRERDSIILLFFVEYYSLLLCIYTHPRRPGGVVFHLARARYSAFKTREVLHFRAIYIERRRAFESKSAAAR